jgi:hypothetical protein
MLQLLAAAAPINLAWQLLPLWDQKLLLLFPTATWADWAAVLLLQQLLLELAPLGQARC